MALIEFTAACPACRHSVEKHGELGCGVRGVEGELYCPCKRDGSPTVEEERESGHQLHFNFDKSLRPPLVIKSWDSKSDAEKQEWAKKNKTVGFWNKTVLPLPQYTVQYYDKTFTSKLKANLIGSGWKDPDGLIKPVTKNPNDSNLLPSKYKEIDLDKPFYYDKLETGQMTVEDNNVDDTTESNIDKAVEDLGYAMSYNFGQSIAALANHTSDPSTDDAS